MVWFNLRVGSYYMKYTALKSDREKHPYCDKDGNILKYISGSFDSGYFINEKTGEKHNKAFFLNSDGKPFSSLTRTKETDNYREVELKEVDDLLTDKEFIIECPKLYEDLINTNKALKWVMSFGGGGKFGTDLVYLCYAYVSELYPNFIFMKAGYSKKSVELMKIAEIKENEKKAKEINLAISGIQKLKAEDLIAI